MVAGLKNRGAPVPTMAAKGQPVPGRDLKNEPAFAMGEIQGDLLLGHTKREELLLFFEITDAGAFKALLGRLPFTSARDVYRPKGEAYAQATRKPPPNPRYGVAFTLAGLKALGAEGIENLDQDAGAKPFVDGLAKRAVQELNDADPATWRVGRADQPVHGVFVVTGAEKGDIAKGLAALRPAAGVLNLGFDEVDRLEGNTRPGELDGLEHFGFLDGVSQPGLRGCADEAQTVPLTPNANPAEPDQGLPGQDLLWPGEFVFGYPGQKRDAAKFSEKGPVQEPPLPWMKDGAFLVIRRLTQLVPEMHKGIRLAAEEKGLDPPRLEAQLVGRWPSGTPIILKPDVDDDPSIGRDENRNNNFEFGDDRVGLKCPWAAHVRKTYPRDDVRGRTDLEEGDKEDEAIVDREEAGTQTRRLLRRGIQFGCELTPEEVRDDRTIEERGLLFKCYVTDLAGQFEFVQKTWCNNKDFVQPTTGIDPIIGQAPNGGERPCLGTGEVGEKPSFSFKPWVTMTGGGYFFAPSISFLREISGAVVAGR